MALTGPTSPVVALRALGLGDFCTAVPALRALARYAAPDRVVLVGPSWQAGLAGLIGVDHACGGLGWTPGTLRRPELAVNLHGAGPESTRSLLITEPRRLVAFRHPEVLATSELPEWVEDEHDRLRWCRLLAECGIPADADDYRLARPEMAAPVRSGTVIVHPGAAARGRRWPADRFAAVARALLAAGHEVVFTGSANERGLCARARVAAGGGTNLAGRTDAVELAAAVATAAAVVCNDTGVAHLAGAYGTPSVVLFGPSSPAEWGPPDDGAHRVIWRGRRGDPHAAALDPGLAAITVDEVLAAALVAVSRCGSRGGID